MLADMAIAVDAARLLTRRAVSMVDEGAKGPEMGRSAAVQIQRNTISRAMLSPTRRQ